MARRENKSMPKVVSGWLYGDEAVSLRDVDRWLEWLGSHRSFYYQGRDGTFTARRELRGGAWYWYAYRQVNGVLRKRYLGRSRDLTEDRLEVVAADLLAAILG